MMIDEVLYCFCIEFIKSMISFDVIGSKPVVGSSYKIILGFKIKVLAKAIYVSFRPKVRSASNQLHVLNQRFLKSPKV